MLIPTQFLLSLSRPLPLPPPRLLRLLPRLRHPHPLLRRPLPLLSPSSRLPPSRRRPHPLRLPPRPLLRQRRRLRRRCVRESPTTSTSLCFEALVAMFADFSSSLFPHIHQPAVKAQKVSRRLSSRVGDLFKPKPKKEAAPAPAKVEEAAPKIEEPAPVAPLETEAAPATETPAPAAEEPAAQVAEAPPAAPVVAATA